MEELLFYNSKIVTLSLILCAVLAAIGAMMVTRNLFRASRNTLRRFLEIRFRSSALRYTDRFEVLLDGYREKSAIFEQYGSEYSHVFNQGGVSKMKSRLDDLTLAYQDLCDLLDSGDLKDAVCLAKFLAADGEELSPWMYARISDEWEHLADWESELHEITCHVIQGLREAMSQSQRIGVSRNVDPVEFFAILEKLKERV